MELSSRQRPTHRPITPAPGLVESDVTFSDGEGQRERAEPPTWSAGWMPRRRFFTSLTSYLQAGCTILGSICCTGATLPGGECLRARLSLRGGEMSVQRAG